MQRCPWCGTDPLYVSYHDEEWGQPLHDERRHFEFLLLETQQAGLSWITILRRREAYRRAFADFDPERVARFSQKKIDSLLLDATLIRNRKKLEAAVRNAAGFLAITEEWGSFDSYIWHFVEGRPVNAARKTPAEIPVSTELSDLVTADLKKRGFSFVGTTTIYAHLQAIGVVNDHLVDCYRWSELVQESGRGAV